MIKQAKAGKPVDMDAVPPPVSVGAAKPSAPAPPRPAQAAPALENLGSSNKATKLDQDTIPKPSITGTCGFFFFSL